MQRGRDSGRIEVDGTDAGECSLGALEVRAGARQPGPPRRCSGLGGTAPR